MSKMEWMKKELELLDWKDSELVEEKQRIETVYGSMIEEYQKISPFGKTMLDRLLKGFPLNSITEKDDEWEQLFEGPESECNLWSAVRYPDLLKMKKKNGEFMYMDTGRCKVINVNSKNRVAGVPVEDCYVCAAWLEQKYPVTLPYMPPNIPWTFYVEAPLNSKKVHILYLKNPGLQILKIDEYYADMTGENLKQLSKKEWEAL